MTHTFRHSPLSSLRYLLSWHAGGLLMLSLVRLALFVAGNHFLQLPRLAPEAFLRGLWFDNVIACYISVVPLVVLTLAHTFGRFTRFALRLTRWWCLTLWSIAVGISLANIPYFLYFFKNLNSSIWNWTEYGATTLGMLFGEPAYYPPMLAFLLLVAAMVWLSRFQPKQPAERPTLRTATAVLAGGLCLTGLCVFGIRGRMGYNPIKVSAAYYCDDAFLNQLGINPAFNLLTSTLDDRRPENRRLALMEDAQALGEAQRMLGRKGTARQPLLYKLKGNKDCPTAGFNVVIILMESMSSDLMGQGQTPFLDSLARQSVYFPNTFSAGNHTNHGLYATLYSYPALMFRNMMKGSYTPRYSGLPTVLRKHGYETLFFMTHEKQYDNMEAFFRTNGFREVYGQEDYPRDKVANSFGVQDDFLYSYALRRLDQTDAPFLATLLSISNHPPYVIPAHFKPRSEKPELQIVEYADWSLKQFFREARKRAWFDRTIFVLLGDHGKLVGRPANEMPDCLNHIPLIFYSPALTPQTRGQWALQMDVQPTLLALLGMEAGQNNFGTDLLSRQRPCAFYTSDNLITARDSLRQFIYNPHTRQTTLLMNGAPTQQADTAFHALRHYVFSMLQAAEAITEKELTQ